MTRQTVGESEAGSVIRAGVGDELLLELPQISGTGYSWSIEQQPDGLTLADDSAESVAPMPGAGVTRRLLFRADGPGRGDLVVTLGQPWPGGAVDRTLRYAVEVDG